MIFSKEYLQELRKTGINTQNLRDMIVHLAVRVSMLELEMRGVLDGDAKEPAASKS